MNVRLTHLIAMFATVLFAVAQPAFNTDTVRVRLVTFYPGREPFEVYGHTELRVTQGQADYYFNYGVFDFNTPGFAWRFALGHTDYLCMGVPQNIAMEGNERRRMVEQELNLTQDEAMAIRDALLLNVQPDNMSYRYRYFTDNCATRPRDIIEQALGSRLHYNPPGTPPQPESYRDIVAHYCQNYAWTLFGIDLALGNIDHPINYRDRMFAPLLLMEAMSHATVERDSTQVPLVIGTETLIEGPATGLVMPPTPWWCSPLAVAIAALLVVLVLTMHDMRQHHSGRITSTIIFIAYGLCGCLIWFLTFVSTHEGTAPNLNAAWLHPFYLLAAALLWCRTPHLSRALHTTQAIAILITAVAWPFTTQAFHSAFLPLMLIPLLRSIHHATSK